LDLARGQEGVSARIDESVAAAPLAVLTGLGGFAPVQDQLALAIGNYALRRGAVSVVFQDPESAEKRLQAGWRRGISRYRSTQE
jgi:hypothetical protein